MSAILDLLSEVKTLKKKMTKDDKKLKIEDWKISKRRRWRTLSEFEARVAKHIVAGNSQLIAFD